VAGRSTIRGILDAVPGTRGSVRLHGWLGLLLLVVAAAIVAVLVIPGAVPPEATTARAVLSACALLALGGAAVVLYLLRLRLGRLGELTQLICEQGRDPVFVKDRECRYVFANTAAANLSGRRAGDVLGLRDSDLVDDETAAVYEENDRVCLQRDLPTLFREKQDVPGQGERSFLVAKLPIHDGRGRVSGLVGVARDVTDELQLRLLAQRRADEMRVLFDDSPLPVLVFGSADLRILDANAAAQACYGYTRGQMQKMHLTDLFATADATRVRDYLRSGARSLPSGSAPYRHKRANGEEFDVLTDSGSVRADELATRLMIVRDLSGEKNTQRALQESAKRYEDLVESGLAMVWMHDLDGRLLRVNAALALALGYEREEMIGRNLSDFIAEEAQHGFEDYLERTHTLRRDAGVLHFAARSGERRVWQYRFVYYPDADPVPYILGSAQDVTLRHRYERRLRDQNQRDVLTKCFNRRYLEAFAYRAAREQIWGCVVVDIDHFKQVNDSEGHDRGDELLCEMAALLTANSRRGDAVVRLGGDEFAVIIPHASEESTRDVAARLHAATASSPVSFSLGWSIREDEEPLESTLRRADKALLQARMEARGAQPADDVPTDR
jgi:diguanylate cyclase (GGDEF)-like protein/PAS domain S-box-containing protein